MLDWATIAGIAGKAMLGTAVGKGAGAILSQAKTKLFPGELERAIAAGLQAAHSEDQQLPLEQHVFLHCDDKQQSDFLRQVMENPALLKELRKPLEDAGKPDVAVLVALLSQVGQERQLKLVEESLDRWLNCFVDTYFAKTAATIAFQVAKQRYLDALACRVDDVKFVGIAVPGEEVEKQEQLVQIFVMPNVREEQRGKSVEHLPDDTEMMEEQGTRQKKLLVEQRRWAKRDRAWQVMSAQKVLSGQKNKVVLLGDPGSGKTTLASYFALMLCEQEQSDPAQIGFGAGRIGYRW